MASETRTEIEAAIPHRPPFLFVDRILERSDSSIITEWHVPEDASWFRGHYPGYPVMPGVLISEFCFQSAAILLSDPSTPEVSDEAVPVLIQIENARFKKIVRPNETLQAEVRQLESLGSKRYMSGYVTSAGKTVARLRFAVALTQAG